MKILLDEGFNSTMRGLERAMDLTWRRNQVISSNIANAETPQYRARELNFGGELEAAFNRQQSSVNLTHSKHLDIQSQGHAHVIEDLSGATKSDGNNVDMDIQMGQLAYNTGRYSAAVRYMRKELQMLRNAIREGGR